ncbi:MAG: hypothetical protein OXH50_17985 [Gemmatimonadetes bacterium]|nr:hypothetical protein [Gemmatimonadota bacterium]
MVSENPTIEHGFCNDSVLAFNNLSDPGPGIPIPNNQPAVLFSQQPLKIKNDQQIPEIEAEPPP